MNKVIEFARPCKRCGKKLSPRYKSVLCPDCQLKSGPPDGPSGNGMPLPKAA